MSEFLAVDRALPGEAPTVEGRLADIMANPDCVVELDEYKLSASDKAKVVAALRLASQPGEKQGSWSVHSQPKDQIADHAFSIWFAETEVDDAYPAIMANVAPQHEYLLHKLVASANATPPRPDREALADWIAYADKLEAVVRKVADLSDDQLKRMQAEEGLRIVRPARK